MTTDERNALVTSAMDLVSWQARRFPKMPRGITIDDLESEGNEALIHAATTFDPDGEIPWRTYARMRIKSAMQDAMRKARTRRYVDIDVRGEDGEMYPRADPRVYKPDEIASAREFVVTPTVQQMSASAPAPGPDAVAIKAAALREAMFAAIREDDATAIVRRVADQARTGDMKAARLFFDLLAPARTGKTIVQQQAIVLREEDLG